MYLPPETADRVRVSRLTGATFDDVQDYINFFGDRVIITGGEITATLPADGTVAVAPCTAWGKETDSDTAIGVFFDFAGIGNIALTDLTTNVLYLDYNAGTPQVVVATTYLTYGFQQDHILLGAVYRNGNATHIVNSDRLGLQGINRTHLQLVEHGPHRTSGMVALAAGVRNLAITAGVLHLGLIRVITPARDTTPAGGDTFTYWYYDGSLPVPAWVAVLGATQISNTQYNNVAAGLAALAPNRYGVHWVFMDFAGHLHVVYGQGDYTGPQAEGADVPAALPNITLMFSVIVAKIICQEGTNVLTITYPWTIPFTSALANDHSLLANLAADDHLQYLNIARHDLVARHPLAVLDPLVCSEAEAAALIAAHAALPTVHQNAPALIAVHADLTTGVHGLGAYGFTSVTLAAVHLYVDIATGNDGDPGTSALPKQTILGALNALPITPAHTSTIHVRPGNYPENNVALEFSRFNTLAPISIKVVNSNDEIMYDHGLATGGGINFLDDAGAGWSINQFTLGGSAYIWIYEGTGRGQVRQIASNTATRITTTVNWAVNPDATSYYVIGGGATMTGTGAYHAQNVGKNVSILGFAHTGQTAYAFRWMTFSSGALQCNYSSVNGGIVASGYATCQIYWNYVSGAYAYGIVLGDTFSGTCRASVVKDKTTAQILVYRGALAIMSGVAGQKNYIDHGAAIGIRVDDGSGCLGASAQVFNGGGVPIDPPVSTIEPRWWS